VYGIGPYTFTPYKVVWKNISGEISGKAEFSCAIIADIENRFLGRKTAIPNLKLMFVPLQREEEAHYLCGVLNSMPVRTIVASYVIETGISTHVLDVIRPPKFDSDNDLHKKIAELSKKAHELARYIYADVKPNYCKTIKDAEQELKSIERKLDLAVAQLFGLSEKDLEQFQKLMAILSGGEIPAEEEEFKLPEEPKISVLNTLLPPDTKSYIEVDVVNPSGEKIELHYELPWGKGSFEITEGKRRIDAPALKSGKYSGKIKYRWRDTERTIDVIVEVLEPSGPRRLRKLSPDTG
jgi:hypothetical protein